MAVNIEQITGSMYYDEEAEEQKKFDTVNHPAHYGAGKIECIEYIEDFLTREEYIGYLRGNIAKKHLIPVPVVEFTADDIVRSDLCKQWIVAFMKEGL